MSAGGKRAVAALALCFSLLLSGCLPLEAHYREVEQLRILQALGLDRSGSGVLVTLAAQAEEGGGALCYTGAGESVSAAIEQAKERSVEEELFTGHLRWLLIGEDAAREGMEPFLSYICRSPDARMDMPLFVLRGETAREAIGAGAGADKGACEALQAACVKLEAQRSAEPVTAAELFRALERRDCALLCALETASTEVEPEEGSAETESGGTAAAEGFAPAGYAILKQGRLVDFLDRDAALGADFLMNTVGLRELVLHDRYGAPVTVEIHRGGTRLHPKWEDGQLRGLEISATVRASVLETGSRSLSAQENADYLTARLEAAVSDRIGAALWRCKSMETDFLGLGERLEQQSPLEMRRLNQPLGPLLPELELSISVQGELLHGHDMD